MFALQGLNDIGFMKARSGSDEVTPYLDKYAKESMVLRNYYTMPNGHSTRSAMLTGKHPAVLGMCSKYRRFRN